MRKLKIKKVDDKPTVIHTKQKTRLHAHEPKNASIKGSNIYTVDRSPKKGNSEITDAKSSLQNLHISLYLEREDILRELNGRKPVTGERSRLDKKKQEMREEMDVIETRIRNLYEDLKDETISEVEYLSLKRDYVAKMEQLKKKCEETDASLSMLKPDVKVSVEVSDNMGKYRGFTELTPDIIKAFIKRITFFGDNRIEVEYTFSDQLQLLDKLIEERKMLCGII